MAWEKSQKCAKYFRTCGSILSSMNQIKCLRLRNNIVLLFDLRFAADSHVGKYVLTYKRSF